MGLSQAMFHSEVWIKEQGTEECSLIPRPFPLPVFDRFLYHWLLPVLEAIKNWQWEWPWNEAEERGCYVCSIERMIKYVPHYSSTEFAKHALHTNCTLTSMYMLCTHTHTHIHTHTHTYTHTYTHTHTHTHSWTERTRGTVHTASTNSKMLPRRSHSGAFQTYWCSTSRDSGR